MESHELSPCDNIYEYARMNIVGVGSSVLRTKYTTYIQAIRKCYELQPKQHNNVYCMFNELYSYSQKPINFTDFVNIIKYASYDVLF